MKNVPQINISEILGTSDLEDCNSTAEDVFLNGQSKIKFRGECEWYKDMKGMLSPSFNKNND